MKRRQKEKLMKNIHNNAQNYAVTGKAKRFSKAERVYLEKVFRNCNYWGKLTA